MIPTCFDRPGAGSMGGGRGWDGGYEEGKKDALLTCMCRLMSRHKWEGFTWIVSTGDAHLLSCTLRILWSHCLTCPHGSSYRCLASWMTGLYHRSKGGGQKAQNGRFLRQPFCYYFPVTKGRRLGGHVFAILPLHPLLLPLLRLKC
jgi:hypothetical protein